MEEKITMSIGLDGEIQMETSGFTGQVCSEVAQKILIGIGADVKSAKNKPEFYEDGDDPVKVLTNI